jgi:hypothetical protein
VLPSVPQALPPARGDVEGRANARARAIAWSVRVVALVLELGWALSTRHWGRWAVVRCCLLIDPFKFKFDRLNMNLTV